MSRIGKAVLTLAIGAALQFVPAKAQANNISLYDTVFSTDYVTSVVGMRGVSTGTLAVAGISGTVTRAILYWHGPSSSTDPTFNANVTFGGNNVVGTNIGFSDDNFWNFDNSQAYRADVTALVTGNGNYALGNFANSATGVSNSASLFVFFNDGNAANNRDVVLYNGNDANFPNTFDADGWNFTLSGINYSGGTANLTTYVSDGQNFAANDDGTLLVNGSTLATGGIFQGLAPGPSVGNGTLGDINQFDVTSFLTLGPNSLQFEMDAFSDALSLIVAAVDLPAGAAPPVNAVPEPGTMLLVGTGVVALVMRARRRS